MTAADIAREAGWAELTARMKAMTEAPIRTAFRAKPYRSPYPAAVSNHPAFTRKFNARLVAVGMAATMNEHRKLAR